MATDEQGTKILLDFGDGRQSNRYQVLRINGRVTLHQVVNFMGPCTAYLSSMDDVAKELVRQAEEIERLRAREADLMKAQEIRASAIRELHSKLEQARVAIRVARTQSLHQRAWPAEPTKSWNSTWDAWFDLPAVREAVAAAGLGADGEGK